MAKDFFIDKYQVPLSKSFGCRLYFNNYICPYDKQANELYEEALNHNLSVIVEVHDIKEAEKLWNIKRRLLGINNRNLKTLEDKYK